MFLASQLFPCTIFFNVFMFDIIAFGEVTGQLQRCVNLTNFHDLCHSITSLKLFLAVQLNGFVLVNILSRLYKCEIHIKF